MLHAGISFETEAVTDLLVVRLQQSKETACRVGRNILEIRHAATKPTMQVSVQCFHAASAPQHGRFDGDENEGLTISEPSRSDSSVFVGRQNWCNFFSKNST